MYCSWLILIPPLLSRTVMKVTGSQCVELRKRGRGSVCVYGLSCLLGVALRFCFFFLFWRVINILHSVIGPEPWDYIGTMITAHTPIKTD